MADGLFATDPKPNADFIFSGCSVWIGRSNTGQHVGEPADYEAGSRISETSFAIVVFLLARVAGPLAITESDERELTHLQRSQRGYRQADIASWSGSWPRTTSIIARTGTSRPGRSTWRIARPAVWISIRSSRMRSKSASTGIPPS